MTCCCSLHLLYKVHAIELDLQSQLHQVVLFSHYSSTELSKEQLFPIKILQPAFQGLAPWRSHPFFPAQQSNTWKDFGSLVTIITNLPPVTYEASQSRHLFVSNSLFLILQTLALCIFTKISQSTINFKTENGSRLITKYYAFTIRVDQVNFLREKLGVSTYSQDRLVAE